VTVVRRGGLCVCGGLPLPARGCVGACVCVRVRARAHVRACVRACVRAGVCVCASGNGVYDGIRYNGLKKCIFLFLEIWFLEYDFD